MILPGIAHTGKIRHALRLLTFFKFKLLPNYIGVLCYYNVMPLKLLLRRISYLHSSAYAMLVEVSNYSLQSHGITGRLDEVYVVTPEMSIC